MTINLLKQIENFSERSIRFNKIGLPSQAARECKKALEVLKKVEKILIENDAIFECNEFLLGKSSITRKPKCPSKKQKVKRSH